MKLLLVLQYDPNESSRKVLKMKSLTFGETLCMNWGRRAEGRAQWGYAAAGPGVGAARCVLERRT